MFYLQIQDKELRDSLINLSPLELKGTKLLIQAQIQPEHQTEHEDLRDAVLELIAYTNYSSRLREKLEALRAIPLAVPTVEWCL